MAAQIGMAASKLFESLPMPDTESRPPVLAVSKVIQNLAVVDGRTLPGPMIPLLVSCRPSAPTYWLRNHRRGTQRRGGFTIEASKLGDFIGD